MLVEQAAEHGVVSTNIRQMLQKTIKLSKSMLVYESQLSYKFS